MGGRARTGRLLYSPLDRLLVVTAGDISTTAEIIAWILPAAIGVPLIVRTHTGTRAERPMPRVL
jgi:hypothetical protein